MKGCAGTVAPFLGIISVLGNDIWALPASWRLSGETHRSRRWECCCGRSACLPRAQTVSVWRRICPRASDVIPALDWALRNASVSLLKSERERPTDVVRPARFPLERAVCVRCGIRFVMLGDRGHEARGVGAVEIGCVVHGFGKHLRGVAFE